MQRIVVPHLSPPRKFFSILFTLLTFGVMFSTAALAQKKTHVQAAGNITFLSYTSAGGEFRDGLTIQLPSNIQEGDLLVAAAGTNGYTNPTWNMNALGWQTGVNSGSPDAQGLYWWWKFATSTDAGSKITVTSGLWEDGGMTIMAYRGVAAQPIAAVSTLHMNDNNGIGHVTQATVDSVSWGTSQDVVSLILMSWQPNYTTVYVPKGYTFIAAADDGYDYVGAGLNPSYEQSATTSLPQQTVNFSTQEAAVPTLQIAIAASQ